MLNLVKDKADKDKVSPTTNLYFGRSGEGAVHCLVDGGLVLQGEVVEMHDDRGGSAGRRFSEFLFFVCSAAHLPMGLR